MVVPWTVCAGNEWDGIAVGLMPGRDKVSDLVIEAKDGGRGVIFEEEEQEEQEDDELRDESGNSLTTERVSEVSSVVVKLLTS